MLFSSSDETDFKKRFVIQFLASYQAVTYQNNCTNGWKRPQTMLVEDAETLADDAWKQWVEINGITA